MFDSYPKTIQSIENKLGCDCYQLLTLEGDDFSQIKGLTEIGNTLLKEFPKVSLFISSNAHDFGTYYGLEVSEKDLETTDIEDRSIVVAEELGFEI